MAPSKITTDSNKVARRARSLVSPNATRVQRFNARQDARRVLNLQHATMAVAPPAAPAPHDPMMAAAPPAAVAPPVVPAEVLPAQPAPAMAAAPPAAVAPPIVLDAALPAPPAPAAVAAPAAHQAPQPAWTQALNQGAFREALRNDEMVFITVAVKRDQLFDNGLIQKVNPIATNHDKCIRAHDIMEAVVEGPKSRPGMKAALGYNNDGTHYQANPIKYLKNAGYLVYDHKQKLYFPTANFLFHKEG